MIVSILSDSREPLHKKCPVCCGPVEPESRRGPRRQYCSRRCRQIAADLSEALKLSHGIGRPLSSILSQVESVKAELK